METRVFTYIETGDSLAHDVHFEWFGSNTVIVVSEDSVRSFSFMEQPTLEQVVKACEEYFRQ